MGSQVSQSSSPSVNNKRSIQFWHTLLTAEKDRKIPPLGATIKYSVGIYVDAVRGHTAIAVVPRGAEHLNVFTLELNSSMRTGKAFLRQPDILSKRNPETERYCCELIKSARHGVVVRKMKAIVLVELAWNMIQNFGRYGTLTNNCRHFVSEFKVRWRNPKLDCQSDILTMLSSYHDSTLNPFFYAKLPLLWALEEDRSVFVKYGLALPAGAFAAAGFVGELVAEPFVAGSVWSSQKYVHGKKSRSVEKDNGAIVPRYYNDTKFNSRLNQDIPVMKCLLCMVDAEDERREDVNVFDRRAQEWMCCRCEEVPEVLHHCGNRQCRQYERLICEACALGNVEI